MHTIERGRRVASLSSRFFQDNALLEIVVLQMIGINHLLVMQSLHFYLSRCLVKLDRVSCAFGFINKTREGL